MSFSISVIYAHFQDHVGDKEDTTSISSGCPGLTLRSGTESTEYHELSLPVKVANSHPEICRK
jgi:hypothetical protein